MATLELVNLFSPVELFRLFQGAKIESYAAPLMFTSNTILQFLRLIMPIFIDYL